MFEKYVLQFERFHTSIAEKLAAKIKYSPELGDDVSTNAEEHIMRSVYNPNLHILPFLDSKINNPYDKVDLRKVIEFTRLRYFTTFDVDYTEREFPVVCDHYELPIQNLFDEAVVLKYITESNGFKNIKKSPFIETEWEKKKVTFIPEVEKMYSNFMEEK